MAGLFEPLAVKLVQIVVSLLIVPFLSTNGVKPAESPQGEREQIGEVLGRPVYRDAIRTGKHMALQDELHRLFLGPVMRKYCRDHKAEIEPTEDEIGAVTAYFGKKHSEHIRDLRERLKVAEDKAGRGALTERERRELENLQEIVQLELKPPGRFFALFILENWKVQKLLYENYGGGNILWQQAGMEAFDATRTFLDAAEKKGDFKITDHQLRSTFYKYWKTKWGEPSLIDDKEQIRTEFLEPEWMVRVPPKD